MTTTADTSGDTCTSTCSLRQAINAANLNPGPDRVHFNIPGVGPHKISSVSGGFFITEKIVIDGYSQPGSSPNTRLDASDDAALKVQVSGAHFWICGDESEINGLSLTSPSGGVSVIVGYACAGAGRGSHIWGNFFELAPDGARSNGGFGIEVYGASNVQIGGVLPAERNIFANTMVGASFSGNVQGSAVLNNMFGADATGLLSHFMYIGVRIWDANGVNIGTDTAPNFFRSYRAITSFGSSARSTHYANHVVGYVEIGLSPVNGIDLGEDGPTPNDPDDVDDGPNELQNYPVLQSAKVSADGITVSGTLDVPAATSNASYRIALYESEACNPSGWGEGERYLGSQELIFSGTPATAEEFAFNLVTTPPIPGHVITATATNPNGSTSEFSTCITAAEPDLPLVVRSVADTAGNSCGANCTLRQAINAANLRPGFDTIRFDLAGTGPHTIALESTLPEITGPVLIDGYSQPGSSANTLGGWDGDAVIKLEVIGDSTLFEVCADDSEIRGLSLASAAPSGPGWFAAIAVGGSCAGKGKNTRIVGNFIGIGPDGSGLNSDVGVAVSGTSAHIGGELPAERNRIASNTTGVILFDAAGSMILNNVFGLDQNDAGRENLVDLRIESSDVTVGLESAINRFVYGASSIQVIDGVGNTLYANEVTGVFSASIDLGVDGVTLNDVDDVDSGPNDLQNFPVLNAIKATETGLEVLGSLDVPAAANNALYRIALYESFQCLESGYGEGERYIGSDFVTLSGTPASAEQFTLALPVPLPLVGRRITATATNQRGSTSEFSACLEVGPPPAGEIFGNGFEG